MIKEKRQEYNTTIKLRDDQVRQIDNLRETLPLAYRSRSDFVIKAIEKEVEYATLLKNLNESDRILFRDMLIVKRHEVFKELRALCKK